MTKEAIMRHEQLFRHFSGVVSTLDKLLKDISLELKEIKIDQEKTRQS